MGTPQELTSYGGEIL
nr:hypothetical protein [Pseudomonas citronellolis]